MKAKYFTAGVLTAVLVIFAIGADNAEPKRTQWEYATYSTNSVCVYWKSPYKQVFVVNDEQSEKRKNTFITKMGMNVSAESYTNIDLLNHAGKDGWELVSVTSHPDTGIYMYFKRPKQ